MATIWLVLPRPSVILAPGLVKHRYARHGSLTILTLTSDCIVSDKAQMPARRLIPTMFNSQWWNCSLNKEVHCKFPGYLTHGKVLLVGHMGLYDYRGQTWHNSQKIENSMKNSIYLRYFSRLRHVMSVPGLMSGGSPTTDKYCLTAIGASSSD